MTRTWWRIAGWVIGCALVVLPIATAMAAAGDLEAGFKDPPNIAKPRTWWHWVSGNVSKEGITADLEAMKRIGVGGAQCFSVDQVPDPKDRGHVLYMSPEWRELTRHAISEAKRLGLELSITDCEGWSESGGPWITPELSMQKVVFSEQRVHRPVSFDETLPQPETVRNYYRDIAVFAFPSLPGEQAALAELKPKITIGGKSAAVENGAKLFDDDPKTTVRVPAASDGVGETYLQLEFAQPLHASSFSIAPVNPNAHGELQVSEDGKSFRKIGEFSAGKRARDQQALSFPEISGRYFRIAWPKAGSRKAFTVGEIHFGAARMPDLRARTGLEARVLPDKPAGEHVTPDMIIPRDKLIDLTEKLSPDGRLKWNAPAGDWTILRIGHTSTGKETHPSMEQTRGLECDKLSRDAVTAQFDGMLAKIIADSKDLMGTGLQFVLMDNWEAGCQNWTPKFREEFQHRRGYDPLPWLVTMSGRYLESPQKTERFLFDLRRTIADLIAENHYGLFQSLLHENKLKLTAEAVGISMPTIADELQCKGRTDVPMGEFWVGRYDDNGDTRETASAAHTYGQQIAAAEAFTAQPEFASWKYDPASLKQQGNEQFCAGVNRFVFHRYAHQPWLDRKPGMTMGPWGTNFERTNTWWEPAKAWMSYLSRCEYMLQQGVFVGDLVYYYGEGAPRNLRPSQLVPAPPAGYDYDGCNREILLQMDVKDGRIVLPSGMSYRVLVLPEVDRMTPEVAEKVQQLVRDGATVYGPRPVGSPSLSGYPDCDARVKQTGEQLWGDCDGTRVTEHTFGKGRIVWGKPIQQVIGAPADFESTGKTIRYIHRRDGQAEIYFVANGKAKPDLVECTFRIADKAPELWDPQTGAISPAGAYRVHDGRTTVPLRFEPNGSVFVVFRKPASDGFDPIVSIRRGDESLIPPADAPRPAGKLEIQRAVYGVLSDPAKQADLTRKLGGLIQNGTLKVAASNRTAGGDPAKLQRKQLRIDYAIDGKPQTVTLEEGEEVQIPELPGAGPAVAQPIVDETGKPALLAWEAGDYQVKTASGDQREIEVSVPQAIDVTGAWTIHFPPKLGAPAQVTLEKLESWTANPDEGVKHFSGTATYTKRFELPADGLRNGTRLFLDLGDVKNLAEVTLNGKDLGILWTPPFRVEITGAARAGTNELEVKVTNLWPNRMIGDLSLPESQRITWAAYQPFKKDSPLLESGLLGPVRIVPARVVRVSN